MPVRRDFKLSMSFLMIATVVVVGVPSSLARSSETLQGTARKWHGILALCFISRNDGWLVDLDNPNTTQLESAVYRTTNGGHDWRELGRLPFPVSKIKFIDALHGWVTSALAHSAAATSDGGVTWESFNLAPFLRGHGRALNGSRNQLIAYSPESAWVLFDEQLFTTNDRGLSWKTHRDLEDVVSVTRASDTVGFALCVDGKIRRTNNSGAVWANVESHFVGSAQTARQIPNASGCIAFGDPRHGWLFVLAAKQESVLCLKTDDGGQTWFETPIGGIPPGTVASVHDVQLRNQGGWVVLNTLRDKEGIVLRYFILSLDDGQWINCGEADTMGEIRVFAGMPSEFVFVLEGKTKLVRYECQK